MAKGGWHLKGAKVRFFCIIFLILFLTACGQYGLQEKGSVAESERLLDLEGERAAEVQKQIEEDLLERNADVRPGKLNFGQAAESGNEGASGGSPIPSPFGISGSSSPDPVSVPESGTAVSLESSETGNGGNQGKAEAPSASKRKKPARSAAAKTESGAGKELTLPELRAKYAEVFKVSGTSSEKKIALTFDDGPDATFTPQILNVLKEHGVKATFFLIGKQAEKHPDVVRRIVREGHVVGNHSYSHPLFTKLTVEQAQGEVEQAGKTISRLAGYTPKLFRPPFGQINEAQLKWMKEQQMVVVNWNVDSLDWKSLSEQQVTRNIMNQTKAGSIILQHSGGADTQDLSGTVKALPTIIRHFKENGYQLVTVPELLNVSMKK
jgi:polysaccharide deacetylase family sporulation protein PdaB